MQGTSAGNAGNVGRKQHFVRSAGFDNREGGAASGVPHNDLAPGRTSSDSAGGRIGRSSSASLPVQSRFGTHDVRRIHSCERVERPLSPDPGESSEYWEREAPLADILSTASPKESYYESFFSHPTPLVLPPGSRPPQASSTTLDSTQHLA